jgi:hypothetical protein
VCGREDDEENMLLCDGCDRGCHTLCARLDGIPAATTWFCLGCDATRCVKSGAAAKQLQQSQACGRLQKKGLAAAEVVVLDSDDDSDFVRTLPVANKVSRHGWILAVECPFRS